MDFLQIGIVLWTTYRYVVQKTMHSLFHNLCRIRETIVCGTETTVMIVIQVFKSLQLSPLLPLHVFKFSSVTIQHTMRIQLSAVSPYISKKISPTHVFHNLFQKGPRMQIRTLSIVKNTRIYADRPQALYLGVETEKDTTETVLGYLHTLQSRKHLEFVEVGSRLWNKVTRTDVM